MSNLQFETKPRFILALQDSLIMIKRSGTHIVRNTDQLLGTFFQPIMFLVLFTSIYSGSINVGGDISYVNFMMAGIIIQTLAFGSTTTALAITNDLQKGIVDRFRSLPMSKFAVLNGHVISDLFRNGISTIVLIVCGLFLGFRPTADVLDWALIIGLIVLLTLAFSWLSAILGIVAKSVEGVQWLSFVIVFPLTFASSAFVNPEMMSNQILRAFSENQPISHMIDALRGLLLGTPIGDSGWLAAAYCIGILAISMPVATWLFNRKTAQ